MADKKKGKLTYFLDHPQIKRHKSPGNGESPGFFGKLAAGKLSNPSSDKPTQPTQASSNTRRPASTSSTQNSGSGQSSWQKAFSKGFRGD
tara:strand:+ start:6696 stop:6965 length:270 start_codon:yes stop_codon:yes gene_type:complete